MKINNKSKYNKKIIKILILWKFLMNYQENIMMNMIFGLKLDNYYIIFRMINLII